MGVCSDDPHTQYTDVDADIDVHIICRDSQIYVCIHTYIHAFDRVHLHIRSMFVRLSVHPFMSPGFRGSEDMGSP